MEHTIGGDKIDLAWDGKRADELRNRAEGHQPEKMEKPEKGKDMLDSLVNAINTKADNLGHKINNAIDDRVHKRDRAAYAAEVGDAASRSTDQLKDHFRGKVEARADKEIAGHEATKAAFEKDRAAYEKANGKRPEVPQERTKDNAK